MAHDAMPAEDPATDEMGNGIRGDPSLRVKAFFTVSYVKSCQAEDGGTGIQ